MTPRTRAWALARRITSGMVAIVLGAVAVYLFMAGVYVGSLFFLGLGTLNLWAYETLNRSTELNEDCTPQ